MAFKSDTSSTTSNSTSAVKPANIAPSCAVTAALPLISLTVTVSTPVTLSTSSPADIKLAALSVISMSPPL